MQFSLKLYSVATDFSELKPYLDTIPGKTTSSILSILASTGMHMSVGIAELDTESGGNYGLISSLQPLVYPIICVLKLIVNSTYSNPSHWTCSIFPYAAATLNQVWIVCGGRNEQDYTAAAIYGLNPWF